MFYVKEDRLIIKQQNEIDIPFDQINSLRVSRTIDHKLNYLFAIAAGACGIIFIYFINNVLLLFLGLILLLVSMFLKRESNKLRISTREREKIYIPLKDQDINEIRKIISDHEQYRKKRFVPKD